MIDNRNGTVTDEITGLMWQKETPDDMTWVQAAMYCKRLSLAGYTDWRMPTIRELINIVDYDRYEPAINPLYFPNTISSFYWSATAYMGDNSNVWCVYFRNGGSVITNKRGILYVRAVREIYGAVQIKKE